MTKRQAENYARLRNVVAGFGVSDDDFHALLRIERTLQRWAERECGDEHGNAIERDEATGKPYATFDRGSGPRGRYAIPDREKGALKRLNAILAKYPKLAAYHQGDPRGCALYVYEKERFDDYKKHLTTADNGRFSIACANMTIDSCYSSVGVALCY